MTRRATLSVITVTKNRKDDLRCTLTSVMSQDARELEIIVVDGESNDGSVELIQQFERYLATKHRFVWISEPDTGLYDAMNKGIRLATAEWLMFLNTGDQLWDRQVLRDAKGFLDATPRWVDLVHTDSVPDQGEANYHQTQLTEELWKGPTFRHNALFIRCEHHRQYPYRTTRRYRICADFDFVYRSYRAGARFWYWPRITIRFQRDGLSRRPLLNAYWNWMVVKRYARSLSLDLYFVYRVARVSGGFVAGRVSRALRRLRALDRRKKLNTLRLSVYPRSAMNPYVSNSVQALNRHGLCQSSNLPRLLFQVCSPSKPHIVILNWPENIADSRFGSLSIIRFLLLRAILGCCRLRKVRLVWVLHNKRSHHRRRPTLETKIRRALLRSVSFIGVHSSEPERYRPQEASTIVSPPMVTLTHGSYVTNHALHDKTIDPQIVRYISFGTVHPYKRIDLLIDCMARVPGTELTIWGRLLDPVVARSYKDKALPSNVQVHEGFVSDDLVSVAFAQSDFALFGHQEDSLIASGGMYLSFSQCTPVIAPHAGRFAELSQQPFVLTYRSWDELEAIISETRTWNHEKTQELGRLALRFVLDNDWDKYAQEIVALAVS